MDEQVSEDAGTPQRSSRKIPRWLLFLLCIPLICGGLCGGLYWIVELRPQHVELDVPPMEGMYGWDYVERSVLEWNGGGRYYFWKQNAHCYSCQSWDAIWKYFDEYLTVNGWVRRDGRPCFSSPETQFLERGDEGFVTYIRQEYVDETYCDGPTVCLAIWKPSETGFEMAVSTENPSVLTEYRNCIG